MQRNDIRNLLIIAGFTLLVFLPFITKPFNVDDPFYLRMAQHIISDPSRPYSFSINWSGELRDVWRYNEATFPPLIPYYASAIIRVFGTHAWILHLFFLVFPLMAGTSMYFVARRFIQNPLPAALLLISAPAFMVSATSIMLDIPLLALMLAAIAFFIYGVDRESRPLLVLSMLAASLALLTKYSAVILLPVMVSYLWQSRRWRFAVYCLIPVGIFALWCAHNMLVYGGMHFFRSSAHVGKGLSQHKMIATATFVSGCFVFPAALFFRLSRREGLTTSLAAVLLWTAGWWLIGDFLSAVWFALLTVTTLLSFSKGLEYYRKINPFILVWGMVSLAVILLIEPWVSGRYLLILLPPAVLGFATILQWCNAKKLLWGSVGVTLFMGILITAADYQWARAYETTAHYMKSRGYTSGYCVGHFGFQYYLEQIGLEALEVCKPLQGSGRYVVAAKLPDPQRPSDALQKQMQLIEYRRSESRFPLRLMSPKDHAGFYSSFWGIFPFTLSYTPLDEFAVFEITPDSGR